MTGVSVAVSGGIGFVGIVVPHVLRLAIGPDHRFLLPASALLGGASGVMLTERGTSFGYNTLVVDMRGLPIMAETGAPVIFDATHSVQQPGGKGETTGGERKYAPVLARAAIAVGVAGIFMECHEDPDNDPYDGPNMVRLDELEGILTTLKAFDQLAKGV